MILVSPHLLLDCLIILPGRAQVWKTNTGCPFKHRWSFCLSKKLKMKIHKRCFSSVISPNHPVHATVWEQRMEQVPLASQSGQSLELPNTVALFQFCHRSLTGNMNLQGLSARTVEEGGERIEAATARFPGLSKRGAKSMHRSKHLWDQLWVGRSLSWVCMWSKTKHYSWLRHVKGTWEGTY